jgi:hypothetical protein
VESEPRNPKSRSKRFDRFHFKRSASLTSLSIERAAGYLARSSHGRPVFPFSFFRTRADFLPFACCDYIRDLRNRCHKEESRATEKRAKLFFLFKSQAVHPVPQLVQLWHNCSDLIWGSLSTVWSIITVPARLPVVSRAALPKNLSPED